MRICVRQFWVNPVATMPMEWEKSAEADVRSFGATGKSLERVKVLVCGASSERLAEMARFLAAFDYTPITARSAESATQAACEHATNIAIWLETEVTARRGVLIDAARRLRGLVPGAESIMIGPVEDHSYNSAAFQAGAYNCMSWPVDYANLARDLEFLSLEAQRRRELWIWAAGEREACFEGLVGSSASMRFLQEQLKSLALNNEPVLITGPVGSGKELIASALHSLMEKAVKGQSYHPLLVYRCCGLTEERAEELFAPRGVLGPVSGERGLDLAATTGEAAFMNVAELLGFDKPGVILIDEISDLPLAAQQKLAAWMLVNKAVKREFPVRILASTRCDLASLAHSGKFHAGLLRLLMAQPIAMPALADHAEDIPMLVEHFLSVYMKEQTGVEQQSAAPALSRDAQRALLRHAWPGSVRELRNAVFRAAMVARNGHIDAADLGLAAPAGPPAHVLDWHVGDGLNRSVWLN